jgi:hypothetical protein
MVQKVSLRCAMQVRGLLAKLRLAVLFMECLVLRMKLGLSRVNFP